MTTIPLEKPAAALVAVQLPGVSDAEHEASLAELARLTTTLGYEVVATVSQRRPSLSRTTVLGRGKLEELARLTDGTGVVPSPAPPKKDKARLRREAALAEQEEENAASDADADAESESESEPTGGTRILSARKPTLLVVDHELTPNQIHNLEQATDADVLDRTGIIVEIFFRHAQSREARLQVEIARLHYATPRLRKTGTVGDRQRGGGVGGRGAGETALELDRRKVRDRIAELRRELEGIEHEADERRALRKGEPRVALVGYTNAGKSSLMRALTESDVLVADQLFATLDTTVRALQPETRPRILISDTVGFIKKLPHDLVASFRSTLDEAREASLLLYVNDAAEPTFRAQLAVTREVLAEIGATGVPSRIVLNKIDRLSEATRAALAREFPDALLLSARDPSDVARLRQTIIDFFEAAMTEHEMLVPYAKQQFLAEVRASTRVVSETYEPEGTRMRVLAESATLARLTSALARS